MSESLQFIGFVELPPKGNASIDEKILSLTSGSVVAKQIVRFECVKMVAFAKVVHLTEALYTARIPNELSLLPFGICVVQS